MKAIFKYPIDVRESFMMPGHHEALMFSSIDVPQGAEFLSADNQNEQLFAWFKVDLTAGVAERKKFVLLATGASLSDQANAHLEEKFSMVKTVLFGSGSFVLHIFMEKDDVKSV